MTPLELYRDLMDLSEIARLMQAQGIRVNTEYLKEFAAQTEKVKDTLFPYELSGSRAAAIKSEIEALTGPFAALQREKLEKKLEKYKVYKTFNPRSAQQIEAYFKANGVELRSTEKIVIQKAMDKLGAKHGFNSKEEIEQAESLPPVLQDLYNLYVYKTEGKGTDPWFGPRYLKDTGLIHPRFSVTGTSTGRLSSSSPNCFDAKTEILTTKGWVPIAELSKSDLVAQWSPDAENALNPGKIQFVRPLLLTKRKYTGRIVSLQTDNINLRVTEDHRCLQIRRKTGVLEVNSALNFAEDRIQPNAGVLESSDDFRLGLPLTDAEIRFLVAVQADGSLSSNYVDFKFKKSRKRDRLLYLLNNLPFQYRDASARQKTGCFRIYVEALPFVNTWLDDKKFTWQLLKLSERQRRVFVEEIEYWDGCKHRESINYCSKHKQNVDIVSTLFALDNKRAGIALYKNNINSLTWQMWATLHRGDSYSTNVRKEIESVIDEDVYCLSVPSSFVLVRRSGIITVTGQCQNIPRIGFGEHVRRAIIPRADDLDLVKADFSNLEFRVCLYLAGTPYTGGDAFKWLLERTGSAFFDVAKKYNPSGYEKDAFKAARDYAKSAVHASDYLEGFVLLTPSELETYNVQKAIGANALRVMTKKYTPRLRRDWEFFGKIVAFTGANFAERIFGKVNLDTRRQALEIQEDAYMASFWDIREWQMRVLDFVQNNHMVKSPTGRFLKLLGLPQDIAKVAIAFLGQGVGADHASGILLRFWREQGRIPLLYVHDELVFEMQKALDNRAAIEYIGLMESETNRLPGFTCPVEIKRGPNWKDMDTIWKNGEAVL